MSSGQRKETSDTFTIPRLREGSCKCQAAGLVLPRGITSLTTGKPGVTEQKSGYRATKPTLQAGMTAQLKPGLQ